MFSLKLIKKLLFFSILGFFLTSCADLIAKRGDARKSPPQPELRVKKNIEEGRGFRLMDTVKTKRSGDFDFASSNELWRASLDTIDFMPLASVNYSGGIIITDWYSNNLETNEAIKISIRFLTNEVRSDALIVKIFSRKCINSLMNCKFTETDGIMVNELKKEILKKAAFYICFSKFTIH